MRIGEILEEKLHRLDALGQTISVQENPVPSVLTAFLARTAYKNLRGFIEGPNVYWWDSYYGTHAAVAEAMGISLIDEDDPRRLLLYLQPDQSIFLDVSPQYRNHPKVAKLIASPYNVLIEGKSQK